MLTITLLFANLSKLVAICNILSKYCLCQNRKPFSDLPRQRWAQNCLPTTFPQSPRRRGSLATLRNRWPSARFAFGCMVGCGVAFVRRYLVPGASTWQPLQIWSRSAPLCICGNHSPSLPHPTTRPWNTVRHRHSTQSSFNPP